MTHKKALQTRRYIISYSSWLGEHITGMRDRPGFYLQQDDNGVVSYLLNGEEYLLSCASAMRFFNDQHANL